MIVAVSINRDHRVFGHELSSRPSKVAKVVKNDVQQVLDDGTVVVNTSSIGKDIEGYAGAVPLKVYIKSGRVEKIEALQNSESPDFFNRARAGLFDKWIGKSVEDAQQTNVDAVSGATYSSKAIIANVQRALQYAAKNPVKTSPLSKLELSPKFFVSLIVVLMAALLPFFVHNRRYHTIQLILNVVVLGFWCGTFISYPLIVGYVSNGVNIWTSIVPVIMLIIVFVYPLFGHKQYYCTNVCPFGSIQQLASICTKKKIVMKPRTIRTLDYIRQGIWAILMLCLWTGVWFKWMDYEFFTAFIFQSASVAVIVLAIVFVLLSFVVVRPYCRFVCPTGTLVKYSESDNMK
jgi:uncharacterized protein with FMN-binding domain